MIYNLKYRLVKLREEKIENGHTSDLIPFWGLTEKEDMLKI